MVVMKSKKILVLIITTLIVVLFANIKIIKSKTTKLTQEKKVESWSPQKEKVTIQTTTSVTNDKQETQVINVLKECTILMMCK